MFSKLALEKRKTEKRWKQKENLTKTIELKHFNDRVNVPLCYEKPKRYFLWAEDRMDHVVNMGNGNNVD